MELQKTLVKFKALEIMLFTNRTYAKHQDIHDQESFRKSGFPYSALQSPIQYWVVTVSSRFVPMDLSYPDDSYPGLDVSYTKIWFINGVDNVN